MGGIVRRVLTALARLVVPVACPGCGRQDVRWCDPCARTAVGGAPWRAEGGAPRLDRCDGRAPLPVWALADGTDDVRAIVVAWKDHGRADLDGLFRPALTRAAARTAPRLAAVATGAPLAVVPVPSSPGARWRRGREPVRSLAAAVARGLTVGGVRAVPVAALRRRPSRDQVGLGARERGRNLASALVLRERPSRAIRRCVLVDDVLTTGATLAAAEEVLERAGRAVVGAFVLAATPPPGSSDRRATTDPRQQFTLGSPWG
ncbi:ComF family protein [Isoptericola sp. b408]|uniref:ComF family protein n=1 Tax=Isoptericola sp. b408 TaxID=3064653 RepID=UPI0027123291|nr:phosphoribosyltransferase family protein [Isoptericola sp. b408]MDO8151498.1 phosphoribosyltransferase family protein [Isoptericola sp. b408]